MLCTGQLPGPAGCARRGTGSAPTAPCTSPQPQAPPPRLRRLPGALRSASDGGRGSRTAAPAAVAGLVRPAPRPLPADAPPPDRRPSPAALQLSFEAIVAPVKEDLAVLNANLLAIVGARHPTLQAAAQQIFGSNGGGGKKLRPVLCFLVARATAQATGLRRGQWTSKLFVALTRRETASCRPSTASWRR